MNVTHHDISEQNWANTGRSLYIMPLEIPCQSGLTFVKFSLLPLAQDLATEKWKTIFFGRSYEHRPTARGDLD
jgi:hypothetical protein